MTLISVPNISEGRDLGAVSAVGAGFEQGGVRLLDTHSDPDHNRSVFTLAGEPGDLAQAVLGGVRVALTRLDLAESDGVHPHVGVVDVIPVIYLDHSQRGSACVEALVIADSLGREGLPVFLFGELAGGRTRAELRRGGAPELARRVSVGEIYPDFGPQSVDLHQGAVLVAARPPLLAFNLQLEPPATLEQAREIAAAIRESGSEGLPGVRALGVMLERAGVVQVSTNIENHHLVSLAMVIAAVRSHAEVRTVEIVGLVPAQALENLPSDVVIANFDPSRRTLEEVLKAPTL